MGGRTIELLATPGGETTDSMVVWLPEERVCLCGNTFGPVFGHIPNLVTMRGDRYRDALTTIASIERVRELRPEVLITGHFDPIRGAERIDAELTRLRDAIAYVHDRTVEGMNAGKDVHTLMREITLPPELEVGQGYGKVRLGRAGDLGELLRLVPPPLHHRACTTSAPDELDADLVDARRRRLGSWTAPRSTLAAGRPVHAIHLAEAVVRADPDHAGARAVLEDRPRRPCSRPAPTSGNPRGCPRKSENSVMTARATFDFTGTQALITGGTSGIGHATARCSATRAPTSPSPAPRPAPGDYDTDLTGMTYRQLILTEPTSIDELVAATGTLDVLVNNAGANFPGGLNEAEPDGFEASVALNLTAPYRLTFGLRKALAASTTPGGASVVFLSSLSAMRAVTMVPGYGAAKAGIASLTHNLAVKWAPRNIRVNAVVPGVIDTPMTEIAQSVPEIIDAELARIPLGPLGHSGRDRGHDRLPVHRAELLHQRRAGHRRRRVHQPVNEGLLYDNVDPAVQFRSAAGEPGRRVATGYRRRWSSAPGRRHAA